LREIYPKIKAAGAELVALSPQLPHYSEELVKERRLKFPVLGDAGNTTARAFGIAYSLPSILRRVYQDTFKINLATFNGDDSWTLPMPARFIIDQHGMIQAADVQLDHTFRPEPGSAIEVLQRLHG
jgi:peroxiredoxin